ncbi:tetratricopeptide repeat protein [Actinokineospora sp. UTMC 2448]|uniref:tetratricopeptide repeat protein n=1 Tax=Actinokineospora sp. UTMC 2448 TaxID=2268449 RepID=UPI0037C10B13
MEILASIDHRAGRHLQAIDQYRQALELRKTIGDTYLEADTLEKLGCSYFALGDYGQARRIWQLALQFYRQQGREEDVARAWQYLPRVNSARAILDESP